MTCESRGDTATNARFTGTCGVLRDPNNGKRAVETGQVSDFSTISIRVFQLPDSKKLNRITAREPAIFWPRISDLGCGGAGLQPRISDR